MFAPIGHIRSPFREKFGVPRQAGLASGIESTVVFDPDIIDAEALRGLDAASHVWLIFGFHLVPTGAARSTVRPPRLGGDRRVGVLASRSPFRPNPIGLSAVRLLEVGRLELRVCGADLVDETPIFDVKPYVPYADAIPDAHCEWAEAAPVPVGVVVSAQVRQRLADDPDVRPVVAEAMACLAHDPRPAYVDAPPQAPARPHWLRLREYELEFHMAPEGHIVIDSIRSDSN